MTTTYYTASTNDEVHSGLFRRVVPDDDENGDMLMERWQDGAWVDWPDLIRACGIGGNSEYESVDLAEAELLGGSDSVTA